MGGISARRLMISDGLLDGDPSAALSGLRWPGPPVPSGSFPFPGLEPFANRETGPVCICRTDGQGKGASEVLVAMRVKPVHGRDDRDC